MDMSNQTKPKLNYWLCRLCIIIFCLIFTGLAALAKGGGETGKETAIVGNDPAPAINISDKGSSAKATKASLQQKTITGTVVSATTGETLPGVNIVLKGTAIGTATDINGNFELTVPSEGGTLVFSFVGYLPEEVDIGSRSIIDLSLVEDITALEEVVVIGYGSMERANVTGAISSIKNEELAKAPVPNFAEALKSQIPGVRVTRTDGKPGQGVNLLIRGENSLNNSNEPLIVIDGVPLAGTGEKYNLGLSELNPNDIESVDILKDAAAASIYGSRGANGVILITTKMGKVGKPVLNISVSQGFTNMVQKPELFNAEEFVQLKVDAANGDPRATGISTWEDVLTDAVELANYTDSAGIQETDYHDVLLRTGKITNVGLSLSGGTEKITFYMNGDIYLEDGVVQHTSYDRYSFRLNSEYNPYKFIKLGAKIQLTKTIADETGNAAVWYQNKSDFTDFLGNTPLGSFYNENNELVPTVKGDQFNYNPLWKYRESQTDRSTSRFLLNPYVEFTILPGLTYKINASAEQRVENYGRFESSRYSWSTLEDAPGRNHSEIAIVEPTTYLLDNIVSYKKVLADKHSLNATFIYGVQTFKWDSLGVRGDGSITDLLNYDGINSSEQDYKTIDLENDEWATMYLAGRLGYSFDRRYNFTATLRYDGSSVFGPDTRWGLFPSISFAWNISEEPFLENLGIFNILKYRISWGQMGNDQIGSYGYIALTDDVRYPFSNTWYAGYTADKLENRGLKWETSQQFNTGLDFGLFNNRLSGSVDVYQTNTIDLILDQQIPSVTGFTEIVSNIGETKNHGVEAILNYRILDGNFKWSVTANWAFDRNEIVHLSGAVDEAGNEVDDLGNEWFIGQDINEIYDFDFIGIWQLGDSAEAAAMHPDKRFYGPGDPKIRDIDGNDTINFEDQTFLGNPTPSWYGGLRNTFKYKGLELTVLFDAVQGVTRINYFYGGLEARDNQVKVDYWTPDNPSNEFPEPNIKSPYDYRDAVRVRDASFVALRNVSLSYTLPQKWLQKVKVSGMQIYIRGNNLKYWTDFVGYSPETDLGRFPVTKNWTIGTNITF
jgi:TonB-linked SusC/RagA family outer membrane protein